MSLKLSVAPSVEPIDLDTAKLHLRVDGTDQDYLINGLIAAARKYCENFQNRAYVTQSWELWLDEFPDDDEFDIPLPPLQSISSIKYFDVNNVESTIAVGDYFVDTKSEPGRVALAYGKSWPSTALRDINGVCITFVAGWGLAAAVPQNIKQAMLLLIGFWFTNRETVNIGNITSVLEFTVGALLWQDRIF